MNPLCIELLPSPACFDCFEPSLENLATQSSLALQESHVLFKKLYSKFFLLCHRRFCYCLIIFLRQNLLFSLRRRLFDEIPNYYLSVQRASGILLEHSLISLEHFRSFAHCFCM